MSGAGKRVAIIQSSYIPWRGLFGIIDRVDAFVLYDDMQFAKRHWHNRNQIKTATGPQWLTIPVETKGRFEQAIEDVTVSAPWADTHWQGIRHAYARAPFFGDYAPRIETLYAQADAMTHLSAINHLFLAGLCPLLDITTPLHWSREFQAEGRKTDRLVSLCRATGATRYLSGPSARDYIEPEKFTEASIALEWMDYAGYREYPQLHGAFEPQVSVLDLLFNTGPQAPDYIRRRSAAP